MPTIGQQVLTLTKLQRRLLLTRGRIIGLGILAALPILLAFIVRTSDNPSEDGFGLIRNVGLGGLVPIVSLIFGAASLGDPAEDGTLIHLWLKPVSRWSIALSSWIATAMTALVFAVIPITVAAVVLGISGSFVVGTIISSALGVLAYSALFVALGLRTLRSLAWGLGYILLWEGSIGQVGSGVARLSLKTSTSSLLYANSDGNVEVKFLSSPSASVITLMIAIAIGLALTRRLLDRVDVQ
jgi:ABC-2 type transport system permease protein